MDMRQLKTFITIARLNSFTQAANQLGYAQSSITSQIQLLEKELGTRLFERFGKNISLTSEGKEFLVYAKQLLDLWEKAKGVVAFSEIPKGTLTIGVVESICAVKLPKFLKEYNKCYPDVEIILKIGTSCELQSLLRENQIDVAILLDQKISSPEFIIEFQQQEPVLLLAAPDHPLAEEESLYPEDVSKYSLILTGQDCICRNLFEKFLKDANVTPKLTIDTSNVQTIKELVISGFGITLLPRFAAIDEVKSNQLTELCWRGTALDIMTQVIRHKDKWISSALREFMTMIQKTEF